MDLGFAVFCPLARCRRPPHPVLVHRLAPLLHASFRPRLATTPLRFAITHLHQAVKRTFTSKLSNMLGTQNGDRQISRSSAGGFLIEDTKVYLPS
jgi:hypothetical protein